MLTKQKPKALDILKQFRCPSGRKVERVSLLGPGLWIDFYNDSCGVRYVIRFDIETGNIISSYFTTLIPELASLTKKEILIFAKEIIEELKLKDGSTVSI